MNAAAAVAQGREARRAVLDAWPDLFAPGGRDMVLGTDVDALLSGAFLHHFFGWQPVGFYDLRTIYLAEGVAWERARRALWVDLDIARPDVESIGHHILTWGGPVETALRARHARSLNPNLVRGIGRECFGRKYPLSTVLLLHWLAGVAIPATEAHLCLLWAADSSWKNMATYTPNVREWLCSWMPHPFLLRTCEGWLRRERQERLRRFAAEFDRHAPLRLGNQCGFTDPAAAGVRATLDHLCDLLDWRRMALPAAYRTIAGRRQCHELAGFALPPDLFSYVLPRKNTINYSCFNGADLV